MSDCERDINDVFDDILMSEEKLVEQGFEEGVNAGKDCGNIEGFHLGYHRGAEIGAELGYYHAIVCGHLSFKDTDKELYNERIVKQLLKVKESIDSFPRSNVQSVDIVGVLEQIRGNFKRICSLLKITNEYSTDISMSF